MTLVTVINLVQDFLRHVPGIENSPELKNYPASLDTMRLPLCLTEVETVSPSGDTEISDAVSKVVTNVYIMPISMPNQGAKELKLHTLISQLARYFFDEANYVNQLGNLQKSGPRISVDLSSVHITNTIVLERPLGSGILWYGFKISYNIVSDWGYACE